MSEADVDILIKFGSEKHMTSFYEKGEIHMGTVDFYKYHTNPQIGDEYENLKYIRQIRDASFKLSANGIDRILAPNINGHIREDSDKKGNMLCLFAVKANEFIKNEGNNVFELDLKKYRDFGDCACIIHKPNAFKNLIDKELIRRCLDPDTKLVHYYDPKIHDGPLDIFCKREKYTHQNELRVYVNYETNESIKFEIGSLENIALFKPNLDDKIRIESTETHLILQPK